eukprot:RCo016024
MHLVGGLQGGRPRCERDVLAIVIPSPADVRRGGHRVNPRPLQRAPGAGVLVVDLDGGDPRPVELRVVRHPEVVQLREGPGVAQIADGWSPFRHGVDDYVVQVNPVHLEGADAVGIGVATPNVGQVHRPRRPSSGKRPSVDQCHIGAGVGEQDLCPPSSDGALLVATRHNPGLRAPISGRYSTGAVSHRDVVGGGSHQLCLHPLQVGVVRGVVDWGDGKVHGLRDVDLREGQEALLCSPQVQIDVNKRDRVLKVGADGHTGAVDVLWRRRVEQGGVEGEPSDQDVHVQRQQDAPVRHQRGGQQEDVHVRAMELSKLRERHGESLGDVERGIGRLGPVLDRNDP